MFKKSSVNEKRGKLRVLSRKRRKRTQLPNPKCDRCERCDRWSVFVFCFSSPMTFWLTSILISFINAVILCFCSWIAACLGCVYCFTSICVWKLRSLRGCLASRVWCDVLAWVCTRPRLHFLISWFLCNLSPLHCFSSGCALPHGVLCNFYALGKSILLHPMSFVPWLFDFFVHCHLPHGFAWSCYCLPIVLLNLIWCLFLFLHTLVHWIDLSSASQLLVCLQTSLCLQWF